MEKDEQGVCARCGKTTVKEKAIKIILLLVFGVVCFIAGAYKTGNDSFNRGYELGVWNTKSLPGIVVYYKDNMTHVAIKTPQKKSMYNVIAQVRRKNDVRESSKILVIGANPNDIEKTSAAQTVQTEPNNQNNQNRQPIVDVKASDSFFNLPPSYALQISTKKVAHEDMFQGYNNVMKNTI